MRQPKNRIPSVKFAVRQFGNRYAVVKERRGRSGQVLGKFKNHEEATAALPKLQQANR